MKIKNISFTFVVLLFFAAITFFSCKKDGPTVATVTVLDTLGRAVKGATVTLWQDTSTNPATGAKSTLRQTKTSDASGKASFDFTLECYLNIEADYKTQVATGEIHVQEHETATETVQFQ